VFLKVPYETLEEEIVVSCTLGRFAALTDSTDIPGGHRGQLPSGRRARSAASH
jgi:hypothetical protein